jgi:hypothetical protein
MYTALRATSLTLAQFLRSRFETDPNLAPFFNPGLGGTMVVSLQTPEEMNAAPEEEGLSVWLYRVVRDEDRLNLPPERLGPGRIHRAPLPLRLHYLMTPLTNAKANAGPETEQVVLGKVLQTFYDHPLLSGADLQDDFSGTTLELAVRLETLSLEEIARVWDSLEGSFQLSASYEVSLVMIRSGLEPEDVPPVEVVLPEFGTIVSSTPL